MNSRKDDYLPSNDIKSSTSVSNSKKRKKSDEASDGKESAKKRRLENNREYARNSRERKKARITELETLVATQAKTIATLQSAANSDLTALLHAKIESYNHAMIENAYLKNKVASLEIENATSRAEYSTTHQRFTVEKEQSRSEYDAEIKKLKIDKEKLLDQLNEYQSAHYNPDNKCYIVGTKVAINVSPAFFFNRPAHAAAQNDTTPIRPYEEMPWEKSISSPLGLEEMTDRYPIATESLEAPDEEQPESALQFGMY